MSQISEQNETELKREEITESSPDENTQDQSAQEESAQDENSQDENSQEESAPNKSSPEESAQEQSSQDENSPGPIVRLRRFSRRRSCPFSGEGAPKIDYKDVPLLQKFISERGKMIPARLSNVSRKKQRELAKAIKRARYLALLPYIAR